MWSFLSYFRLKISVLCKKLLNQTTKVMKKLLFALFVIGMSFQALAQEPVVEKLSEIRIVAADYKYLDQANSEEVSVPVKMLREKVASYNVKDSPFYRDDYELYSISFYIPEGKILAAYDQDGKLLRTIERFKDVTLPQDVTQAVVKRFPKWTISNDVYRVSYHNEKGVDKKYKLRLENGDERMWVKIDDKGNFF